MLKFLAAKIFCAAVELVWFRCLVLSCNIIKEDQTDVLMFLDDSSKARSSSVHLFEFDIVFTTTITQDVVQW